MAVKIRLSRKGRKNLPIYHIVVADARSPRDGRFIKKLGTYNPHTTQPIVTIDEQATLYYLINGAQPTSTAKNILSRQGLLYKKHLQIGVKKAKITQEQADIKFKQWFEKKKKEQEKLNKKEEVSLKKEKEQENKLKSKQKSSEISKSENNKPESKSETKPENKSESKSENNKPENKSENNKPENKSETKPENKSESKSENNKPENKSENS